MFEAYSNDISQGKKAFATSRAESAPSVVTDLTRDSWRTSADEAKITIDLEGYHYVESVEIIWWGVCCASKVTVETFIEEDTRTGSSAEVKNIGSVNRRSIFSNVNKLAKAVIISMSGGKVDPWFRKYKLGVYRVAVRGKKSGELSLTIREEKLCRDLLTRLGEAELKARASKGSVDTVIRGHRPKGVYVQTFPRLWKTEIGMSYSDWFNFMELPRGPWRQSGLYIETSPLTLSEKLPCQGYSLYRFHSYSNCRSYRPESLQEPPRDSFAARFA